MVIDAINERGFSIADKRWSDETECRFPLIDGLGPLPVDWMILLYFLMTASAFGMCLGFYFRTCSRTYVIIYWYLLFLEKSYWNNHSYLFGWWPSCFPLVKQATCVYFYAGLKKIDPDWLAGYSMRPLADHWTFGPFRLFLPNWAIDLLVVHWGGFVFDLSAGFLFVCSRTRPLAYFLATLFNGMNSQLFSIGMFPFVMMALHPIFSHFEWPTRLFRPILTRPRFDVKDKPFTGTLPIEPLNSSNHRSALMIVVFMSVQLWLPWSHGVTKGFNTWTDGPYGYSWDMMVHNWNSVHSTVTVLDNRTNRTFYLDVEQFSPTRRWLHHADMVKQFADCVQERFRKEHNLVDSSVYVDAWVSLNGRYVQRMYNPQVDISRAHWSPFEKPTWVLPLLEQFANERNFVHRLQVDSIKSNSTRNIFMADLPGHSAIHYVHKDLVNSSLLLMSGKIVLEQDTGTREQFSPSSELRNLKAGHFYRIHIRGREPARLMFSHTNASSIEQTPTFELGGQVDLTQKFRLSFEPWFDSLELVRGVMVKLTTRYVFQLTTSLFYLKDEYA
ncbi:Vitamin K-dependent gamma-carboxylase [Halotydeus destructor]|nr:Vitamin K-dependent gamma-carboxylase [Halotydeus destructor]